MHYEEDREILLACIAGRTGLDKRDVALELGWSGHRVNLILHAMRKSEDPRLPPKGTFARRKNENHLGHVTHRWFDRTEDRRLVEEFCSEMMEDGYDLESVDQYGQRVRAKFIRTRKRPKEED